MRRARVLVLALLPAWACDCSESNGIGKLIPQIEVSPSGLDFAEVPTGATRFLTITVRNTGSGVLTISSVDASMPYVALLEAKTIEPGLAKDLEVAFSPPDSMNYPGMLTIMSDAENNKVLSVSLNGSGVAGFVDVNPRSIAFGAVTVGAEKDAEIVINNRGVSAVSGNITPDHFFRPEQFALTGLPSFASPGPYAIAPRGSTHVDLTYRPLATGPDSGRIIFETCGARCGVTVTVTATAADSTVRLEPVSLDFGDVGINQSKALPLIVHNDGAVPIDVTAISVSGAAELTVTSPQALPQTLAAGSSFALSAVYKPTAATTMSGLISVETTDRFVGKVSAPAIGHGVGPHFEVAPPVVEFGAQVQVIKHRRALLLVNSGSSEVLISSITVSGDPSLGLDGVQGLPIRLGGGETFTVQVTYLPTGAVGAVSGNVHIETNDPMSAMVDVPVSAGFATQACALSIDPGRANFGLIEPPSSRAISVSVRNTGTQACNILSGEFQVPGEPSITAAPPAYPLTLAAGASLSLKFTYAPTDHSEVKATYVLHTDDAVFPDHRVSLVGSSKAYDDLFVQPPFLDFGQTAPNCVRSGTGVTLFNAGTSNVQIDHAALTSSTAELFAPSIGSPMVPAGLSYGIPVTYAPVNLGPDFGVLEIFVKDRPYSFVVPVQGSGTQVPTATDHFTQTVNRGVDVLFVIDNSCSMGDDQANLSANIGAFINNTALMTSDFRMAITTTDVSSTFTAGVFRGPIMSPTTPNLALEFQLQASVGVLGSGIEQGLEAMDSVFHNLGGPTSEFLRSSAGLVVVIISDEDDSSPASTVFYYSELQHYAPNGFLTILITGQAAGCVSPTLLGMAAPAPKYEDFKRLTSGTSLSICTDWSMTLQTVGSLAFGLRTSFTLSKKLDPTGHVQVTVDGVVLPSSEYTLDPGNNAVILLNPPPDGAQIAIDYTVGC
ncbi:MAG: choice-of-anchor D domain-containing protein [Myxococcota bacterium]